MSASVQRQAIVVLDGFLTWLGVLKSAVGVMAVGWLLWHQELPPNGWAYLVLPLAFSGAALMLRHDLYWPSFLALTGAAFADWPAREAWGVELSDYPLLSVQALVAVPLWLAAMDYYPGPMVGLQRKAAVVCCWCAFIAGWAAPLLVPGSYWLVVAPLALVAIVVLMARMRASGVRFGTRGWICCGAVAPMAIGISLEVLVPSLKPLLWKVVPWTQVCLALGAIALIVTNLGGKSHDRKGGTRVPGVGLERNGGGGRPKHDIRTRREGRLHDLVPLVRSGAGEGRASVPGGQAGLPAQAALHGQVHFWRAGRDLGSAGRGAADDDRGPRRHDLLRPATAEVEPEDFGTGPLTPLAKEAR